MEKLNLRWGNPDFLTPFWAALGDFGEKPSGTRTAYIDNAIPELEEAIRKLHQKYNNADIEGKHIVIGNGASQILLALMETLDSGAHYKTEIPYFSRLPILARLSRKYFDPWIWKDHPKTIHIVTSPNNPDNVVQDKFEHERFILDSVYNWPIYTNPIKYNADIMVYNASKAFGLASTRLGWAIIKDEALAKRVKEYMEYTTGGVSIDSQYRILNTIRFTLESRHTIFEFGRKVLNHRWEIIEGLKDKLPFKVLNTSGMFMLCEGKCPETIIPMLGTEFGLTDDYFRLNLGCSNKDFERFLSLLKSN